MNIFGKLKVNSIHKLEKLMQEVVTRLEHLDNHFEHTDRQILELTIYNENLSELRRLTALKEYIYLGGNGACLKYATEHLLLPNKEIWKEVLEAKIEFVAAVDKEKYATETFEKIRKTCLV